MTSFKNLFFVGCAGMALAACGPDDYASPGGSGSVTINNTTTATTAPTTPTGGSVTAASGCPTIDDPQGLIDAGTIIGPTGTWRVCTLPARINRSIRLTKVPGLLYQMNGRVDVGTDGGFTASSADTNVTLNIDPGVIIYAGSGVTWLAVNRGNRINAVGTATQPIVFTSRDNVLGLNNNRSHGQWGGVVLMGRGRTTDCTTGSVAADTCERQTEGAADPARYGGTNNADNSGRMSYVQIRYSGYVLGANSELQSLTGQSIGTGTVINYLMSFNSSDDAVEFFGGSPRMKYFIAVGGDDDSLDVDTGAQADFQYGLLMQHPGQGDGLFEIDSNGRETDTPRTVMRVSNYTMVQPQVSSNTEANAQASLMIRGNSDVTLVNSIINTPNNECLRLNGSGATPTTLTARSVVMNCNATRYIGTGSYTATQVAAAFAAGTFNNRDTFTPSLTNTFINGANETAIPVFDVSTLGSFYTPTTYIGAVKDSADNWWSGWTCNSDTANFGTGNSGACTSLPTN